MNKFILAFTIFFITDLKSQIKVGLWEPYYKGKTEKSVFFNGKNLEDFSGDADEHGMAVGYVLNQNLEDKIKLYHAGFTPTTRYLRESGILLMSIEERKKNLTKEHEYCKRFAIETVAWFKKQKVKVVNMSFGNSATIFAENNLNLGNNVAERLAVAEDWMRKFQQSFDEAFKSAPDILFVVAAGNDELDMQESFDVPGLSEEPNVICIGALDKKGLKRISNYGKQIDIYVIAEDVEWIDSKRQKHYDSGTSLAVPQITRKAIFQLIKTPKISSINLKKMIE